MFPLKLQIKQQMTLVLGKSVKHAPASFMYRNRKRCVVGHTYVLVSRLHRIFLKDLRKSLLKMV